MKFIIGLVIGLAVGTIIQIGLYKTVDEIDLFVKYLQDTF